MLRRTNRPANESTYLLGAQDDDEAIERYLVLRGQVESTRRAYARILGQLRIWCAENDMVSFRELLSTHASQFQSDLAKCKVRTPHVLAREIESGAGENRLGMSLTTVDYCIGVVRTFFDNLLRAGYVTSNPFFELADLSSEEPVKAVGPKLRGLDEPLIAELLATVETLPRHTQRHLGIYHQARWVLCLATLGGMSAGDMSRASLGSFEFRSNNWYLVPHHYSNAQSFRSSQSAMISEQLVCELRIYCQWLSQELANNGADPMNSLDERLALPMVSAVGNVGLAVNEFRLRKVLRHTIDRAVARLQQAGQGQKAALIESYRRRTGPPLGGELPGPSEKQVDAMDFQRFYAGHIDCPRGPDYVGGT